MRVVINNTFVDCIRFSCGKEEERFLSNIDNSKILELQETDGVNRLACIFRQTLTKKIIFVVLFNTYNEADDISLFIWEKYKIVVLDTGNWIYSIDWNLNIKARIEGFETIGFYLINESSLLVLTEMAFYVLSCFGNITTSLYFDDELIDFKIENEHISITTSVDGKIQKFRY